MGAFVSVLCLALDVALPSEVSGGVLYVVPVLIATMTRNRRIMVGAAAVGSTLALLGYVARQPDWDPVSGLANRAVDLLMLWVVTLILVGREDSETLGRESESRFQKIVEAVPDGIVIVDDSGTIVQVNQRTVELFGFERHEMVGGPLEMLIPPHYRATHPALADGYFGRPYHRLIGDYTGLYGFRKDATSFPVEIGLSPITLGGRGAVMATVRDISSRKRAEEARVALEMRSEQSRRMEAIGQLAGGVAHDFNNALTIIRGRCSLLLEAMRDPESSTEIEQIDRAAGHAAALTQQLLAFARRQVIEPSVENLATIVSELHGMLRRLIPESIDMILNVDENRAWALVDRTQIEQIVLNLATNARDAMPEGGRLVIEVHHAYLSESFAHANPGSSPGSHVVLAVRDTGAGMDAATQARIFDPFFTTKQAGRGTGLGLATVYGAVKQSKGYIHVLSEVGLGSSFEIYFPEAEPAPASLRAPSGAPPVAKAATVLLVEDEADVRGVMRDALVRDGQTVVEAASAEEARRACEALGGAVDLLVSDLVMPDVGGYELAVLLTELDPRLKVLFVSGYVDEAQIKRLSTLPCAPALLAKPLDVDAFRARVRACLARVEGEPERLSENGPS